MAGFMNRLAEINALADRSPGFVWRLQTAEGEHLLLVEAPGGSYSMAPSEATFETKMNKVNDIMDRYRNTLRVLAK